MLKYPGVKASAARHIFRQNKKKILNEYIAIDYSGSVVDCEHVKCGCLVAIKGNHPMTADYKFSVRCAQEHFEADCHRFMEDLVSQFSYVDGHMEHVGDADPITLFCIAMSAPDTGLRPVQPPIPKGTWPGDETIRTISPKIEEIVKVADRNWLLSKGLVLPVKDYVGVYSDVKEPSLQTLCLRSFGTSMWHIVYGKTDGQPHFTDRSANLYPTKIVEIMKKHGQGTHKHKAEAAELLPLYPMALDILFHRLGTSRFIGKLAMGLDLEAIQDRPLHASAGINPGREEKHVLNQFTTLKVSPSDKKYENHIVDLQAWINFLEDPTKPFPTYWKTSIKNEYAFHPGKSMTTEEADKNAKKGRTFCTPGSAYAAGELLVGQRMKLERGEWITIGHSWSRGGADKLALSLGISTIEQAFEPRINEADVTGLDHVVPGRDTDLYMSLGLVYDDPSNPLYASRYAITEYLIKNLIARITQMMGPLWVEERGSVPSGLQNTSHMDSWEMAFWFVLYCLRTAFDLGTPYEIRVKIVSALVDFVIMIVLYGDDHLFSSGVDEDLKTYINILGFKGFLAKYYNVELRDDRLHITFGSIEVNGTLVHKGACFLKHYFVINPYKDDPGQPLFLPFRETKDYVIRAVVGREPGDRGPLNVILSCIGHAYGTYASNRDAYDRLFYLFHAAVKESGMTTQEAVSRAVYAMGEKDIASARRAGIDVEDILKGFPTWDALVKKNRLDWSSHSTKQFDIAWLMGGETL